ncbi:MAG: hypothetical protein DCC65_14460 [Planctomycetota bacterium]|nr:MAG: hypothetical protein DCC65_14460 [Planctomycetota bacterium]
MVEMKRTMFRCLPVVLVVLWIGACADKPADERDEDMSRPATFGFQTSLHQTLIDEGKITYERYCLGCHGAAGDGAGEAAVFLNPRPRNFVTARFKFSSTRSGQLPTDDDLRRTIKNGLRGSAMPPFNLLSDRKVDALVAYIKTFSPEWTEREPASPVPFVDDPYGEEGRAEAVARGEAVYHGFASCWSCHPAYVSEARISDYIVQFGGQPREVFRPGLYESDGKANDEGEMVYPPDFRRDYVRAGMTVRDIYRSVSAGITGTAMPTWIDSIDVPGKSPGDPPVVSQKDLWAMSYYVQELLRQRPPLFDEGQVSVRNRPRPIYLHGAPTPAAPSEAAPTSQPDVDFEF